MNASKDQRFDFVFFKIKKNGQSHPLPLWQECEDELRDKYQIRWDDLLKIFESLSEKGYIYKGNDNEYRIHPDHQEFLGFESYTFQSIQQSKSRMMQDKKTQVRSTWIAVIGILVSLSGWVAYFSNNKLSKANEQIEYLERQNDSIKILFEDSKMNFDRKVDSLLRVNNQNTKDDTAINN